ncbi:MAG TPA: peroxidase family protein [Chthoniobacterales bacterium]|nr:peroxidase family protein [Chthoniobacterales bacterium]
MTCAHAHMTRSQPRGYYSRLFGKPAQPIPRNQETKLVELGKSMRYEVEREGTLTPRVGYTYFGQFIGHDLTYDTTSLDGPYLDPERTPNYRTPSFDLDHVYGGGPESSPHLYEGEEGAKTFKIGFTRPTGYRRDLPVEHGTVLIGDQQDTRNLDNLILRQLHVVFLKFHNEAIRQVASNSTMAGLEELGSGTLFERAQRLVRWHYQWIVRHDFLPRVLHNDVWTYQERRTPRRPDPIRSYSVPIEFSLAAFRFGHSMVRNAYRLNCRQKRVVITELMTLGQKASPIPDDYLIEWGTFLDGLPTSGPPASSSFLDTSISRAMHGLSAGTIRLSNRLEPPDPSNLPVRTLLRGARAQLPSGQEVADALLAQGRIKPDDRLTTSQVTQTTYDHSGSVLRKIGLERNTPLFYYLLKEAELKAEGLTLGPVGSHILSEVIQGALETDPDSYLSVVGPKWSLPSWRFPSGSRRPITSLIGIVQLVEDDKLLPECDAHWRRFRVHPSS